MVVGSGVVRQGGKRVDAVQATQALAEAVSVFPAEEIYLPFNVSDRRRT